MRHIKMGALLDIKVEGKSHDNILRHTFNKFSLAKRGPEISEDMVIRMHSQVRRVFSLPSHDPNLKVKHFLRKSKRKWKILKFLLNSKTFLEMNIEHLWIYY